MGARENDIFLNFTLDKLENALYNTQAFGGNAAIAQPVERILGKDEVASSNLASSSNETPDLMRFGVLLLKARTGDLIYFNPRS